MKKKIILISIIGVLLIIVSYLFLSKVSYKKEITINIGDSIPNVSNYFKKSLFLNLNNNEIKWENLDETKSGTYIGKVKIKNKTYTVSLLIEDKEAPIINCDDEIKILKYQDLNINDYVTVNDNSSDDISLELVGEYNTKKIGKYEVTIKAKDKSNNESSKSVTINVISEAEKNGTTVENIGTTSKGYVIQKIDGIYYVDGVLIANKTYDLPNSYNPGNLLQVFNNNFSQMKSDASTQGINLYVISGFRSYQTQTILYNNYAARDGYTKADTYSARAGHSEHQTGLAADINSLSTSFINTKEGTWLNNNCYKYGFIIRYVKDKDNITGYMYEPWHIRYVGVELATELYNNGNWITIEEYFGIDSKYN